MRTTINSPRPSQKYDDAIKAKSDYASAYLNRGIALANLQRKDEAAADFNKVMQISSDPSMRADTSNYLEVLKITPVTAGNPAAVNPDGSGL